jgi:hypothetical protein
MTNKEKYIEFCKQEHIPIYSQYWWLDTLCGKNNWDVLLYEKGGEIWASMPYYMKKKYGFISLTMPKFTQHIGPYIKYPKNQKYPKKLSLEKEIMNYFINELPKFDSFIQNFHYDITNWLPFHWKNFTQTTNYTYVIEDFTNINENFSKANKRLFKKGIDNIKIIDDLSVEEFYEICKLTYQRQNLKISYSLEIIKKIFETCNKRKCGKALFAVDDNNNIHSVSYIIWDNYYIYSIIGGGDPKLRNSGAKNLIFFEEMKLAQEKNIGLNFEGSMIENIETFYRSFGATQKPYFNISKTNSKLLKIRSCIREFRK